MGEPRSGLDDKLGQIVSIWRTLVCKFAARGCRF